MKGARRGGWTTPELLRLRELFPRCSPQHVATLLKRSVPAVRRRAERMFRRPLCHGPWTPEEDDRLREAFGIHAVETIALLLGRSRQAVRQRIAELRRSVRTGEWSAAEITALRRWYGTRPAKALTVCLGRPLAEIEAQARALCLARDKRSAQEPVRMPRWTYAEIARLRELYGSHDNLYIARTLGRSVSSVANKASQLGLSKAPAVLREMGRRNVKARRRSGAGHLSAGTERGPG